MPTGPDEADRGRSTRSPRFSIVTAVYDVARYLPDFIASVERQSFPLESVEVIAINDGSTDESLAQLNEWRARSPELVTVVSQANQGQAAARNHGLGLARGEWVTFTDPDDMLDINYLRAVDDFIVGHGSVQMIATNRLIFSDDSGELTNRQPLRYMFAGGDQLVDLSRFPKYFHGAANAAFFRRAVVFDERLRFDPRIRPVFEDQHFCARYVFAMPRPIIGYVASARYVYRLRADGTSSVQVGRSHAGRFTSVPRHGHLDLLRLAEQRFGQVPEWLQNQVLFDLSWYFGEDATSRPVSTAARGEVAIEFVQLLGEIARRLDPAVVASFNLRRFDSDWRDIFLHSFAGTPWCSSYVVLEQYDADQDWVRLSYRFVGDPPAEAILRRGRPLRVHFGKIRVRTYFEHPLVMERIAWVPADGSLRVLLNGEPVELRREWPGAMRTELRPLQIKRAFGLDKTVRRPRPKRAWRDRLTILLAATGTVRRHFADAWVLADRLDDAGDNAEALFRYLRRHRRDVNAWFVLKPNTSAWKRLAADGYKRLIPYGSLRWRLLMLNCTHFISSHVDEPVCRPAAIRRLRAIDWHFTFLQHGVTKDDISPWLNSKQIHLMITATAAEAASISGDLTPYLLTAREVRTTGFPRFDRLGQLDSGTRPQDRDLILICPTWRHWLTVLKDPATLTRVVIDDFPASEYAQNWLGLLHDERLRKLGERAGLRVGFLPHPNIQSVLRDLDLPDTVLRLSYADQDIQHLLTRTAVLVTDFSSLAFDAAYLRRQVVYFQFDTERIFSGGHIARRGYFDYPTDGFGPVTGSVAESVTAIEGAVYRPAGAPEPDYRGRMETAFPRRDGRSCRRVVAAIEELTRQAP